MNFGGTVRLNRTGWLLVLVVILLVIFIHLSRTRYSDEVVPADLVDLKLLLKGAIESSELGGKKVFETANGNLNVKVKGKTLEGVDDLLTNADYASHCEMYHSLLKAFPKVRIKSEEDKKDCPESSRLKFEDGQEDISTLESELVHAQDVTIWIDPLDATKEYTEKLHKYVTTMVCVAVKGVPIIGVIHKPFSKETSWAWFKKRSSKNLQQSKNSDGSGSTSRVIVSMSHKGAVEKFTLEAFGKTATILTAAGAGYKVLELAHNKADVYIHTTQIKKWDICAGNAIVNSLGGRMSMMDNSTIDYSHDSNEVNKKGLLASIRNHNHYVEKVKLLQL